MPTSKRRRQTKKRRQTRRRPHRRRSSKKNKKKMKWKKTKISMATLSSIVIALGMYKFYNGKKIIDIPSPPPPPPLPPPSPPSPPPLPPPLYKKEILIKKKIKWPSLDTQFERIG